MRAREYAWLEYQSGNIKESQWLGEREVIAIVLGTSRTRNWWFNLASPAYNSEFAQIVNELIENKPEFNYAQKVQSVL